MLWRFTLFLLAMAFVLWAGWQLVRWSTAVKLDERRWRDDRLWLYDDDDDEHQNSWRNR